MQDHERCLEQGIDHIPRITKELYWKCRLRIVNEKINSNNSVYGKHLLFKGELHKIKKVLKNRVEKAQLETAANYNEFIEEDDHETCVLKGYSISSSVPSELEGYYVCRQELLTTRTAPAPFAEYSYEDLEKEVAENAPAKIRTLEEVWKEKREKAAHEDDTFLNNQNSEIYNTAKRTSNLISKYPMCSIYKIQTENFDLCVKDNDLSQKCYNKIPNQIAKRKLNDQIFCTKQSILQFPDELAVYESTDTSKKDDKLNTGPKLSKITVLQLREQFIIQCQKQRKSKLLKYAKFLSIECQEMSNKWSISSNN